MVERTAAPRWAREDKGCRPLLVVDVVRCILLVASDVGDLLSGVMRLRLEVLVLVVVVCVLKGSTFSWPSRNEGWVLLLLLVLVLRVLVLLIKWVFCMCVSCWFF